MKKKIIFISVIVVLGLIAGISLVSKPQNAKAVDSPLTTQVDQQNKELANHEARITNTENNVQDLQANTNTAPSKTQMTVPSTAEPSTPAPAVAPTPVTVVSYRAIPVGESTDCEYTYSDGTTYQFHWKVVTHGSAWVTDGNGQNGHSVSTTNTNISGKCDSSVVGQEKVN